MAARKTGSENASSANGTPARVRGVTPFDEAKRAQSALQALELKRQAIIDGLSEEAAVMLEALEELRAKQTVASLPTSESSAAE